MAHALISCINGIFTGFDSDLKILGRTDDHLGPISRFLVFTRFSHLNQSEQILCFGIVVGFNGDFVEVLPGFQKAVVLEEELT